jgi:predicted nicotinamide N-methyase
VAARHETEAFGVKALKAGHPEVRKLKKNTNPRIHGTRHWPASWLLIDYLERRGLPKNARVMEIGCGWGLASVYCAKRYRAEVTAVDLDADVFPYVRLHAEVNGTRIKGLHAGFAELNARHLARCDVLIGSDICFWDELREELRKLILRALGAGVRRVIIADPGRYPFEALADYFVEHGHGVVRDWTARAPHPIRGRILKVTG